MKKISIAVLAFSGMLILDSCGTQKQATTEPTSAPIEELKPAELPENKYFIFGVRAVIEAVRAGRELNKIMILKGMDKELFMELKKELQGKDFNLLTCQSH